METWCRLCANEKYADELTYNIDDEFTNIKQKLIDCCRWNEIADDDQVGVPKMICKDCNGRLEQCWLFAESVSLAQQKIHMHSMDVKPMILLQIEKLDTPFNEEDTIKAEIHEYTESISPIANFDFDFDESMCQSPVEDYNFIDKKDLNFASIEETHTTANIDCDLLALLSDSDKNADGTVNMQKISELNLDDWSILKIHCSICKKFFDKHRTFKSHFKIKHPGEALLFHCTLCNLSTAKSHHTLQNHIIKMHRPYLKYCCKKCNIFYWHSKKLKKHMSGLHPIQAAPSNIKLKADPYEQIDLLCEICGKNNFSNQSQMKYHARSHMPIEQRRSFECYLCRAIFSYKKSLIPHMALHSGAKPQFQCDICQLHFSRTDALRRHQLIHLNKLPHRCSYCEKGFRTKFNLKVHERTHTGERPYECRYCSYRSADGPNLGKHIKQKHKNLINQQNNMTAMSLNT